METTNETIKAKTMSPEEYEILFDALMELENTGDIGEIATNTTAAYKVHSAAQHPEHYDMMDLINEAHGEGIVLKLLWVLDGISKNNGGAIRLP